MQMVEFKNTQGQKVYYNPANIVRVTHHTGTIDKSDVYAVGATVAVTVDGKPEDVAAKVNAAMLAVGARPA